MALHALDQGLVISELIVSGRLQDLAFDLQGLSGSRFAAVEHVDVLLALLAPLLINLLLQDDVLLLHSPVLRFEGLELFIYLCPSFLLLRQIFSQLPLLSLFIGD